MEENNGSKKIGLSTLLLILALIIIVILVFCLFNNNNNNDDEQLVENDKLSFSELMDLIYPVTTFKEDSSTYTLEASAENSDFHLTTNVDENIIGFSYCNIYYSKNSSEDNSIDIYIIDTESSTDSHYTVSGINEEIVDVKAICDEVTACPSLIYFLTRTGNVYYASNNNSVESFENLNAQKVDGLSQVISIKLANTLDDGGMHSYNSAIASTYNGNYEVIYSYIDM